MRFSPFCAVEQHGDLQFLTHVSLLRVILMHQHNLKTATLCLFNFNVYRDSDDKMTKQINAFNIHFSPVAKAHTKILCVRSK